MICSAALVEGVVARSAAASVVIGVGVRREMYEWVYFCIVLGVPLAIVCGICWASPWSRYGRK